jgi:hypothetical protein
MMSEIVNDPHAARFAAKLQPPRNPAKLFNALSILLFGSIVKARCHCCHRRIPHVEFADQRNFEHVFAEPEPRRFRRVNDVPDPLCAIFRKPTRVICAGNLWRLPRNSDRRRSATPCHSAGIMLSKRRAELDLVRILEDVRVVELNIRQ